MVVVGHMAFHVAESRRKGFNAFALCFRVHDGPNVVGARDDMFMQLDLNAMAGLVGRCAVRECGQVLDPEGCASFCAACCTERCDTDALVGA